MRPPPELEVFTVLVLGMIFQYLKKFIDVQEKPRKRVGYKDRTNNEQITIMT